MLTIQTERNSFTALFLNIFISKNNTEKYSVSTCGGEKLYHLHKPPVIWTTHEQGAEGFGTDAVTSRSLTNSTEQSPS